MERSSSATCAAPTNGQSHTTACAGLLPENVEVIAGPGCPVCIVPASEIDEAVQLARKGVVVTCSRRITSARQSVVVQETKAEGADVRIVYGVSDAVEMAQQEPERSSRSRSWFRDYCAINRR